MEQEKKKGRDRNTISRKTISRRTKEMELGRTERTYKPLHAMPLTDPRSDGIREMISPARTRQSG
jgi:hypothetical protein